MSLPPDGTSLSPECLAMLPGIAVDAQGNLAEDIPCRRCGYNLRGLAPAGTCPECGTPVGRSLIGDLLRYCDPQWVTHVSAGTGALFFAVIAGLASGCIASAAFRAGSAIGGLAAIGAGLVPSAMKLLVSVLVVLGTWQYAAPELSRPQTERDPRSRPLARALAVLAFVLVILVVSISQVLPSPAQIALGWAQSIVAICGYVALMFYARTLALRLPDVALARTTRTVMWGLAITMGLLLVSQAITAGLIASQPPPGANGQPLGTNQPTAANTSIAARQPDTMDEADGDETLPDGDSDAPANDQQRNYATVDPNAPGLTIGFPGTASTSPLAAWAAANPVAGRLLPSGTLAVAIANFYLWLRTLGLLGRYGVALKAAAEQARTTWAAATPTAGPPTAVS